MQGSWTRHELGAPPCLYTCLTWRCDEKGVPFSMIASAFKTSEDNWCSFDEQFDKWMRQQWLNCDFGAIFFISGPLHEFCRTFWFWALHKWRSLKGHSHRRKHQPESPYLSVLVEHPQYRFLLESLVLGASLSLFLKVSLFLWTEPHWKWR
jgi:hypothetical protein